MSQYQRQKSISVLDLVWKFKFLLIVYILCISTVTFVVLYALGGVPEELRVNDTNTAAATTTTPEPTQQIIAPELEKPAAPINARGQLPKRIIIEKIGVDAVINNPTTINNNVLNEYLLRGVL